MEVVTSIVLGAVANAVYDIVVMGMKRTSGSAKLEKLLSNRQWERLYEQAGLRYFVKKYRDEGSQDTLVKAGQTLAEALEGEFSSLILDVNTILQSQVDIGYTLETAFSQLRTGQDEIKKMLLQISQEQPLLSDGMIQIGRDALIGALTTANKRDTLQIEAEDIRSEEMNIAVEISEGGKSPSSKNPADISLKAKNIEAKKFNLAKWIEKK